MRYAIPISLIMWALFWWGVLLLTGCATLTPDYVAPELEHISHATQHEPFTHDPTRYGANIASVVVGYELPHNLNLELGEGVSLDRHYATYNEWGEIVGPREQFTARVRYMFRVKP